VVKCDVSVFNNFTYVLNDPANGDQFRQKDDRLIVDGSARKTSFGTVLGIPRPRPRLACRANTMPSVLEPRSFRLSLTKQSFTPMNSSSIVSPTREADERRVALLIPCGHA